MRENGNVNYFHLNLENRWPGFKPLGLDLGPDGAWRLPAVPLMDRAPPAALAGLQTPIGPAGVAIGPEGSLYYSQPEEHRLRRIDGCDGADRPLLCLGGKGGHPTQLRNPRGLLYHPLRQALLVADSGNHRIQIFDLERFQLLEIWGQPVPGGPPDPGDDPGRFSEPWSLANDDRGNVYIVDYGNRRVQKVGLSGQVVPGFEQNSKPHLDRPTEIAITGKGDETRLYVLDPGLGSVVVLDTAGRRQGEFGTTHLQEPMGLAAADGAVYVGDNALGRLLTFRVTESELYTFAGTALGYEGPVAALAIEQRNGILWLHAGGGLAPLALQVDKAYAKSGVLWGGPFGYGGRPARWHRFKAIPDTLEDGAHLQFYIYTAQDSDQAPAPPVPDPAAPFGGQDWQPMPPDVLNGLLGDGEAAYLWLGAHFEGEGIQSPVLEQIRISYDHSTYREHLPAIFGQPEAQKELLDHLLSLFESFFDDTEAKIRHLGKLFDPEATPASWLPWLAGWLALDLDESWPEAQQREAIAHAFAKYARRGTASGLRESLRLFVGVDAHVEEPIVNAGWWALPGSENDPEPALKNSLLGFTTRLAPVEADGAVLGTTAILDHSHLITLNEFGAPLFENMAHQFTVQVYRRQTKDLERIRAIIESEKPAHTAYQLCIVEPRMRVGFQARLGIDTIVAGPAHAWRLGEAGQETVSNTLGGKPPGQIGVQSRVGTTALLSGSDRKPDTWSGCVQHCTPIGASEGRKQNA